MRPKPLLDQLADGLNTLDVLSYIRAFPAQLEPLFVIILLRPSDACKAIRSHPNSAKFVGIITAVS